ncbi:hypothetical protein ACF090_34570 [Streptomyces sp. NPDC014892]|uniref:hypothetical protein n=1 Tax=Streptomyces sp. NPDC014892 TaxID=3364930 RepID=UPI0036F86A1F
MNSVKADVPALDEHARSGLAKVADVLLPGTGKLPSARSVGVHEVWLDRVLAADPRLIDPLKAVGAAAAAGDSCTLEEIEAWAGPDIEVVVFALTSAYYISPAVLEALGYPGQVRRPISQATPEEAYSEELLAPVRERGPIYVPTP